MASDVYAECHYVVSLCRVMFMLSVIRLNVFMLSVIMPSAFKVNVFMPSVVAPIC